MRITLRFLKITFASFGIAVGALMLTSFAIVAYRSLGRTTGLGKEVGGEFRMSPRFGPFFLWPESLRLGRLISKRAVKSGSVRNNSHLSSPLFIYHLNNDKSVSY